MRNDLEMGALTKKKGVELEVKESKMLRFGQDRK